MTNEVVSIILRAKDEASKEIHHLSNEVGGLGGKLGGLLAGAGSFGAIAAGITTVGAAAIGLGKQFVDTTVALNRVSIGTGVSVEKIQILRKAFVDTGLAAEASDKALSFMARSIGRNDPLLAKLGITTRDAYEALTQLGDRFRNSGDAAVKQSDAMKLAGRAGGQAIAVFEKLSQVQGEIGHELTKSGGMFSGEDIKKGEELRVTMEKFEVTWHGMWTRLERTAVPSAIKIVEAVNSIIDAFSAPVEADDTKGLLWAWKTLRAQSKAHEEAMLADEKAFYGKIEAERRKAAGIPTFGGFGGGTSRGKGGGASWDQQLPGAKEVVIGTDADGTEIWGPADDSAAKSRKKRLEEIEQVMRVGARQAAAYLSVLEQIETRKKGAAMSKQIIEAFSGDQSLEDLLKVPLPELRVTTPNTPKLSPSGPVPITPMAELPNLPKLSEAMIDVGVVWGETVQSILSSTGLIDAGFGALYNGLQSGFGQVFANITNKTQTFKSAMKTIFSALSQEILAALARIAAAKVFQIVLGLAFPGLGPILGIAAGGATGGTTSGGGVLTSVAPVAGPTGSTYYINALNARDIVASLQSPRGELRTAGDTVLLGGSY